MTSWKNGNTIAIDIKMKKIAEEVGDTDIVIDHEKGTDNNQWFYSMECLKCGHKYNKRFR